MFRSRLLPFALATIIGTAAFLFYRSEPAPKVPGSLQSLEKPKDPEPLTAVETQVRAAVGPTRNSKAFDELLKALPNLDPEERDGATQRLIRQLREKGPAGLKTVADFLSSGRDVPFRDGYQMDGVRIVEAPSLRIALIEALRDWEGSTGVLLAFLRSPASIWERVLAARNLELQYPGTYREQTIAAIKDSLASKELPQFGEGGEAHLFATASHFKAVELLPELERVTAQTRGANTPRYLQLLNTLPSETRTVSLERFFAHSEIADEIELAPQTLNQWPYEDARVQAYLAGVFADRLNVQQRVAMLDGFDASTPALFNNDESLFTAKQNARELDRSAAKAALAEAQARKTFLANLAKTPDQPTEVQEAIKDAQKRVIDDIAMRQTAHRAEPKPLVEVPIGLGDGKAQIKGRRIEQLELKPATVIPPDENSTDAADR